MSEKHPDGYLKHPRIKIKKRDPEERKQDYSHIWAPDWDEQQLRDQGERCMDCGVPTCMGGCPIGNLIPDWNDLVYRSDWKQALKMLHATNNFPEFTGYTCPAPCEDSCVLAINDDPVTIKNIERAIYDRGWEEGWIKPQPPKTRTGKHVAVIGSGPAGLAAAQQLNRAGHHVTVYERDDVIGGLMSYGIPDFKFAKELVARRVNILIEEGIEFKINTEVGVDLPTEDVFNEYDATCIAIGAQRQRDVRIPGRELDGIHFAMEYLIEENRRQNGKAVDKDISAKDMNVVVLGGGDTGADCVATAHRQGAKQVVQISINPRRPLDRSVDTPWPFQPLIYRKTYAQEEGGKEEFSLNTLGFTDIDNDGRVDHLHAEKVEWTYDENRRRIDKTTLEPNLHIPADLVLVAIGFSGPQSGPFAESGFEFNDNGTFTTDDNMMTSVEGVFSAGDAHLGQSLVVWAIGEGRDAARNIDKYLMGETHLPSSLRTANPPVNRQFR
ncbi:MAG: glutamate synthase subunit beta [Candidatus Marinimicrobia bacterium]|nr:glutamate synthase subunit beta [Candidatus Neomarinimicrobiota bacterium]MCF7828496.1 glutamate synthase subunit beta [Candidatus Neomarinimicrobiota bacterium]MCF7881986.1 glutamate synthase subunit beta [Candidatus Neomarinimicrobiota bacterium]